MRAMFPGHYRRTNEELERIWDEGLFVLDANVLLNLYRYSKKTRDEYLGVLRGVQDRLWIPRRVAEEFLSGRLGAIRGQKKAYAAVKETLTKARKDVENKLGEMHRDPGIKEAGDLREKAKEYLGELVSDAERLEKEGDFRSFEATYSPEDDEIWSAVEEVFEGRVGVGLSEDGMKEVLEAGPRRYESRVPPGYEDKGKPGDRKFGDLILWFETIEKAKDAKKHVLFVTDDNKKDWWDTSVKPPLPRPELGNEMRKRAGVLFHMFLPLNFSEWAGAKLGQRISREAAEEIEELRALDDSGVSRLDMEDLIRRIETILSTGDYRRSLFNKTYVDILEYLEAAEKVRLRLELELVDIIDRDDAEDFERYVEIQEQLAAFEKLKSAHNLPHPRTRGFGLFLGQTHEDGP